MRRNGGAFLHLNMSEFQRLLQVLNSQRNSSANRLVLTFEVLQRLRELAPVPVRHLSSDNFAKWSESPTANQCNIAQCFGCRIKLIFDIN
jgi:hypothetical protein